MDLTTDYPFLSKIYLELINKKEFKIQFQAAAPEIYADIESTYINPNCTCRVKVETYIKNYKEKLHPFLLSYLKENQIELNLQEIEKKYKTTPYIGKVEKVKITEWTEYVNNLTRIKAVFRNFSVVKVDDEHINVFFL